MLFKDILMDVIFDAFVGVLLMVLVLITGVLYYSFYLLKKINTTLTWSQQIDQHVSEAIVYGIKEDEQHAKSFSQFSQNSSFRNLFLEKLVASEKKFSGAAHHEINKLFQDFHLEKETKKKLNQKQPYLIAGGLQEVASMHMESEIPKIAALLNHPSPLIYQEAQYAMVSFKGFNGLDFLDTVYTKISEWQQLRLLLSVTVIPKNSDEAVSNWLRSTNNSVIIFTLRLLRKFQMLSFYPHVLNLLDHSSEKVRIQAVQTLQSLENSSTVNHLIESYPDQTPDIQVEIIRVLKISRDQQCVDFLKKQLTHHSFSKLKIFAAEALFSLGHSDYLINLAKDQSSPEQLTQIVNHSMQLKLC